MADGLGFAGAGLADEDVPGDGVEVFAGGAEFFDALFEVAAQVVEAGAAGGLGDALGGGGGVAGEALGERIGLALGVPLDEGLEGQEQQDDARRCPTPTISMAVLRLGLSPRQEDDAEDGAAGQRRRRRP